MLMEQLKKFIAVFIGYILAVLDPISGMIYALLITMFGNFVLGFMADYRSGNSYSHKKAFKCFKEAFFITGGMFFSAAVCDGMDTIAEGVVIMRTICWAAIIIYIRNMVRNTLIILPDSEFFSVLMWAVNFKFMKRNAILKEYNEYKEKKEDEQKGNNA